MQQPLADRINYIVQTNPTYMKKKNVPKDIEDLVSISYDPSRRKDKEKWISYVHSMLGAGNEKHTIKFLSKFGTCVRIPKGTDKTFDYRIDESKILVEVRTIQHSLGQDQISNDPNKLKDMIGKAIKHIHEKDASDFPGYARGGLVYIYSLLCTMTNMLQIVENDGARIASAYGLDYVVFVPEESSTRGIDYDRRPVAFVKDHMLSAFRDRLPGECRVFGYDVV